MKVLITGGAGYIGTSLIPLLLQSGKNTVRVFDNLLYGGDHLLQYISNHNFEFVRGDVRNEAQLTSAAMGCDVIVNLAALVGFSACRADPQAAWNVNASGVANLIKATSPSQYIIQASTGSNYGNVDGICTEETPLNPLSIYAETKVKAEELVRHREDHTIFRFATAFGVSPRLRLDLLINNLTYLAVTQKYLVVYEADNMRTFLHVRDIAKCIHDAIFRTDLKGNIYNVGSEHLNYYKRIIADLICDMTGAAVNYVDYDEDIDKRDYEVSYKKIAASGFDYTINIHNGISELIRSFALIEEKSKYRN
jgi:nucleoside-diphosphate-sugar epimerase